MINDKEFLKLVNEKKVDKAFSLLLQWYKQPLYWHIRKLVFFHEDADDVLQNTFIKVYKNLNSFKGKSTLKTWMFRIAYNESINLIRRKNKKQFLSSEEATNKVLDNLKADSYFEGSDFQLKLNKALLQLPEKQRIVFQMRYFDDLKFKEIAAITGTSVGALKASYHLAEKKIKTMLIPL